MPSSLLLLSRALYLPDDVPNVLQATLSTLPQPIVRQPLYTVGMYIMCVQVEEAEVRVADSSGETVDNKTRLEVIRQQETLIQEEAAEKKKEVSSSASILSLHPVPYRRRAWKQQLLLRPVG